MRVDLGIHRSESRDFASTATELVLILAYIQSSPNLLSVAFMVTASVV